MSRLFVCKPLAVLIGIAFSGCVYAGSDTWQPETLGRVCRAPDLSVKPLASARKSGQGKLLQDATRITADKAAGEINRRHKAAGDVIIERNDEVLNSDWADYDQSEERVYAGDRFTLTRADGQTVQGDRLVYDLANKQGSADNTEFAGVQDGRRLQGVGRKMHMLDENHYKIDDAKFNTCETGDTSWYIQAREVRANRETGIGVARHAKLVFGGVPILYTPWVDFPLNGGRKSGLLVPTVSVGSDGFSADLPYYFNLAPNYDATVAPGIITSRGAKVSGEFRYLQPNYSGSLNASYMPHDSKRGRNNRTEIKINHSQRFGSHLSGGVSLNQVSDDDYYRDFYGRNEIAESVNLDRKLWLDYSRSLWGEPFSARFLLQKYQTLSDANGYKDRPYAMLPRLSAQWQKNIGNMRFDAAAQFTRFDSKTKQSGNRMVLYPSLKWDFHNQWGYIRPKIGLHATRYWLDKFHDTPSRSASRVLPVLNADSGITLERQTGIMGQNLVQTLEPRLFYNYIPSKSQNDLPNFDSSLNDFSYDQLFRENIYSGSDRINASNSLSAGVQTRFLDGGTGREYFRAGVGQKYYFSNDSVLLNGSVDNTPRKRGDLVAFAGGRVSRNWYADTNWHWSADQKTTQRYDAGVRYNPEAGKVLSARFKYGRSEEIYSGFFDKLRHVDLAAQWPIKNNIYAVGRLNYSVAPRALLEQTLGLEYKNPCGCWSASFVAQRYVSGYKPATNTYSHKNAFFFTLQLKDLSNIGNNPYEQLRLGIPGYTKTNEVNK
nr:LPS-assembly protein LptD [uncultured Kingella sp.]